MSKCSGCWEDHEKEHKRCPLIAAAPDMLELIRHIALGEYLKTALSQRELGGRARAILAKVRGGEK